MDCKANLKFFSFVTAEILEELNTYLLTVIVSGCLLLWINYCRLLRIMSVVRLSRDQKSSSK